MHGKIIIGDIKNIRGKILNKIKELNLKIENLKLLRIDLRRHTSLVLCQSNNKKLIFRTLIFNDKSTVSNFRRELLFYRFLKEEKIILPFLIPFSIVSNEEGNFRWMLREYIEADSTGDRWGFSKKFLNDNNLHKIINHLRFIQSLTKKLLLFFKKYSVLKIPKRDYQWYQRDFQKSYSEELKQRFRKSLKRYLTHAERKKLQSYFRDNKKILDRYCLYLTHGDLYPGNVFIKSKKLLILDWEEMHINNPMYDAAFIWIYSWRNEKWRNYFLEKFLELFDYRDRKNCRILFNLSVLRIIFRNITALESRIEKGAKDTVDLNLILKKHLNTVKSFINSI